MFAVRAPVRLDAESWKSVRFGEKQRLFKIHSFLFMSQGRSYSIEIQESIDGSFLAHAENTSDPHEALKSFHGSSVEDCLQQMITQIESKEESTYETRTR